MKLLLLVASLVAVCWVTEGVDNNASGEARLVAAYSTRTIITLTTTSITGVVTCYSETPPSATCQKRRLRDMKSLEHIHLNYDLDTNLESALDDYSDLETAPWNGDEDNRGSRLLALTVWSTTSSTYTVTATSTNSATTLSISYFCNVAGLPLAPACPP